MHRGSLRPLGDPGKGGAAAAGGGLDLAPRRAGLQHGRDALIPLGVLLAAPVEACRLGPGLTLRLTAATVVIVLAGDRREDIEQHAVDGLEHAPHELVGRRCQAPRGGQVERHDAHPLGVDLRPELYPVIRGESGQAIDLLDQQHVAGTAILQQAEQLRPRQGRAALVLDIGGGDRQTALGREGIKLRPRPGRVLFGSGARR